MSARIILLSLFLFLSDAFVNNVPTPRLSTRRHFFLNDAGFVQLTAADFTMLSSLVVATIAVPKYQKKPTLPPKIVEELPMPTPVEVEVALVEEDVEEEPVVALPEKKEPLKLPKSPPPLKAVKIPDVEPPLKTMPSPVMAVARPYTPDMVKKEEPVVTPADLTVEEPEPVPVVPVQEPPQKKRKKLLKLVIATVTIALTGTVFSGVFASRPAFALFTL